MLGRNITYDYEPCKSDRISKITIQDENAREQLYNESTNGVQKILKEVKVKNFNLHIVMKSSRGSVIFNYTR